MNTRPVDMLTSVGSIQLLNPVMTASGTAGHGDELADYLDYSELGAFVAKSVAAFEWDGNPPPRLAETSVGMMNSVGLPGPGVERWLERDVPRLIKRGARIVASIWGKTLADYEKAAQMLADAPKQVIAVEVNISCPNLEDKNKIFSHSASVTTEIIEACNVMRRPMWAKLSPNTDQIVDVAGAAHRGGAEAVTLINTVAGMVIDTETRRPVLGAGRGGLSGPAVHPVAVRAVFDVHAAHPDLPIVGVGGVARGVDAVELMMAGANAIQVGTMNFAEPKATHRVIGELQRWCEDHQVQRISDLIGVAHKDLGK